MKLQTKSYQLRSKYYNRNVSNVIVFVCYGAYNCYNYNIDFENRVIVQERNIPLWSHRGIRRVHTHCAGATPRHWRPRTPGWVLHTHTHGPDDGYARPAGNDRARPRGITSSKIPHLTSTIILLHTRYARALL